MFYVLIACSLLSLLSFRAIFSHANPGATKTKAATRQKANSSASSVPECSKEYIFPLDGPAIDEAFRMSMMPPLLVTSSVLHWQSDT